MYKEIVNSLYGSVVRGISDKLKYDLQTRTTQILFGAERSNPIIAYWTTAFIRSVKGECLKRIQTVEGRVVSVTTEGFINDLTNLEE
jgi:hypothetical protein